MNENSKYITLAVNEKQQLVGETDTVWESSDPSVVSVSPEGIVRGNAPGVATVSAASIGGDGVEKDVTVTIKDGGGGSTGGTGSGADCNCCTCCDCDCDCCCCCPEDTEVPVQCIQVCPSFLTLSVGESASVGATVYPKNATDKGVE